MLQIKRVFPGFSVDNKKKAKEFYTTILGLQVHDNGMGLEITLPQGGMVFIYEKEQHQPATFTILNFVVENIDKAVDELMEKGITFQRYKEFPQDERAILRGLSMHMGPDIAWFTDPAGNILSVIQEA